MWALRHTFITNALSSFQVQTCHAPALLPSDTCVLCAKHWQRHATAHSLRRTLACDGVYCPRAACSRGRMGIGLKYSPYVVLPAWLDFMQGNSDCFCIKPCVVPHQFMHEV